jgi:hypothetical protein
MLAVGLTTFSSEVERTATLSFRLSAKPCVAGGEATPLNSEGKFIRSKSGMNEMLLMLTCPASSAASVVPVMVRLKPMLEGRELDVPTDRRGLWGQLILGFFFEPLARQAVLDLKVLVFGRVVQHLEAGVLGVEFL